MLSSVEAYSQAIYALVDPRASVHQHTIRIYARGARLGVLEGQIEFDGGLVLRVFERLDFARQRIMTYSYEIWRDQQQLCWYDPQEHPNDASLASIERIIRAAFYIFAGANRRAALADNNLPGFRSLSISNLNA